MVFRDRRQKTLPTTPSRPAGATEWALVDWLNSQADRPDIPSQGCTARWNGERVDWDWALAALA